MPDDLVLPTPAPAPAPIPSPAPVPAPAPTPEKTSFSLEYVQELRAESAKYRTKASEAQSVAQAAEVKATEAQTAADAKVAEASQKADQRIIRAELKAEAIKAGMVDLDGLKLADLSGVKLDENGEVVGGADALKALKEAKPYLFGGVSTTSQPKDPPKKEDPKPFDARTATSEERAAKAREMGLTIRKH